MTPEEGKKKKKKLRDAKVATQQRSGFLSSSFVDVSCHGWNFSYAYARFTQIGRGVVVPSHRFEQVANDFLETFHTSLVSAYESGVGDFGFAGSTASLHRIRPENRLVPFKRTFLVGNH